MSLNACNLVLQPSPFRSARDASAFRLRSVCFPCAFRLRSVCVPFAFRLRSACVPSASTMNWPNLPCGVRMNGRRLYVAYGDLCLCERRLVYLHRWHVAEFIVEFIIIWTAATRHCLITNNYRKSIINLLLITRETENSVSTIEFYRLFLTKSNGLCWDICWKLRKIIKQFTISTIFKGPHHFYYILIC